MTKSNKSVNDAQLKGRRTSLGKKTNEELINIILRKDSTERKQSEKIKSLNNECTKLSVDFLKIKDEYSNLTKMIRDKNDCIVKLKDEIVDFNKIIDNNIKKIKELKDTNKMFRKVILYSFGAMFILMCVLGIFVFS